MPLTVPGGGFGRPLPGPVWDRQVMRSAAMFTVMGVAVSLVAAACTAPATSPATGADPGDALTVPALWVNSDNPPAAGVELATVSSADDTVAGWSVDLATQEAQGAGPAWSAAAGQAAVIGTLNAAKDPAGVSVTYTVTGPIDGPSAGGILTVGTIAAIRGVPLLPNVTMTGTIGADGSIGMVGGVPYKVQAAQQAGYTTVLVPKGQAPEPAIPGITTVEVSDLAEAYQQFTGLPLFPDTAPAAIAPEVTAASETQARELAGTDSMATALEDVLAKAAKTAGDPTAASLRRQAGTLTTWVDQYVAAYSAEAADRSRAGTASAGYLAAVPGLLALAVRSATLAEGAAQWAETRTSKADLASAAKVVAEADATARTLVPALLAVAESAPGARPADPVKAERVLRAYTQLEDSATVAGRTYLREVERVSGEYFNDNPEDAAVVYAIRALSTDTLDTTPGLEGAISQQAHALAGWQTTSAALDLLGQGSDQTTGHDNPESLLNGLAAQATTDGRDPSVAVWLWSLAAGSSNRTALELCALTAASMLATA